MNSEPMLSTSASPVSVQPRGACIPRQLSFDISQLVREAAANAARHGKASRLHITATRNSNLLQLDIEDNGSGLRLHEFKADTQSAESSMAPRSITWRVAALSGK